MGEVIKDNIKEYGDALLGDIYLLSIIGEIEGHENTNPHTKSTKYEHILPKLAQIEYDRNIKGVLMIVNTVGGDVSAGLALAEMITSLSKPVVALIIGDCHSIGVPLVAAADYSFITPTSTMIIHPVRMNGVIIGAPQTYDYFKLIQDRIAGFIAQHRNIPMKTIEKMMVKTGILTKDLGTILVGEECVKQKLVDCVGGISDAYGHLCRLLEK
ncbi:MAG: ClpP family protease [Lachnospiraceae bacterium]